MSFNTRHPDRNPGARAGFTLLELIIAVTLLAVFLVPMLEILLASELRATRYTQARQVKRLAQQKLHDRVHFAIEEDSGTFEEEGHADWTWEIDPPQARSQGQTDQQVILEYTIRVYTGLNIDDNGSESDEFGKDTFGGDQPDYQYTIWTFPSDRWIEDQWDRSDRGEPTLLYGDPSYLNEGLPATGGLGTGR